MNFYFRGNQMIKTMQLTLFLLIICTLEVNSQSSSVFIHPRGLINASEVVALRNKVRKEPFLTMLRTIENSVNKSVESNISRTKADLYTTLEIGVNQAAMFLFIGDRKWAENSFATLLPVLNDTAIFNNPLSFGLSRANCLRSISIAYDFCYQAWDSEKRDLVNGKILEAMYSLQASMGFAANYNIESNWMGVRYGSTLLASIVWDETLPIRSRALPIEWDDIKRLRDHISNSIYSNGWNGESMGYHDYAWSFIGPAIIALQNNNRKNDFILPKYAPDALNSLWSASISAVSIESLDKKGLKADLSDDNTGVGLTNLLAIGMRIYPEEQKPALLWMHNYLFDLLKDASFLTVLYLPENMESTNPEKLKWLTYTDPDQGVVIFRNRFLDFDDIVFTYSATSKRVNGHQGPDTNTARLIGLGSVWIDGPGRTGEIAGQSNIFPDTLFDDNKSGNKTGRLLDFKLEADGSGYAVGAGSCMNVDSLVRSYQVDFSHKGQPVIIEHSTSLNGKLWRMNTPEFNEVTENTDGFTLTSPEGSTLKITILGIRKPLKKLVGKVPYGGKTTDHNPGILYHGKVYKFNKTIDCQIDKDVTVVYCLQPKGSPQPEVSYDTDKKKIRIGEMIYNVRIDN